MTVIFGQVRSEVEEDDTVTTLFKEGSVARCEGKLDKAIALETAAERVAQHKPIQGHLPRQAKISDPRGLQASYHDHSQAKAEPAATRNAEPLGSAAVAAASASTVTAGPPVAAAAAVPAAAVPHNPAPKGPPAPSAPPTHPTSEALKGPLAPAPSAPPAPATINSEATAHSNPPAPAAPPAAAVVDSEAKDALPYPSAPAAGLLQQQVTLQ